MDKIKLAEKLFKAIYGELIDVKYLDLSDKEVFDVATGVIKQYVKVFEIEVVKTHYCPETGAKLKHCPVCFRE